MKRRVLRLWVGKRGSALPRPPAIAGLTEPLADATEAQRNVALGRLAEASLVRKTIVESVQDSVAKEADHEIREVCRAYRPEVVCVGDAGDAWMWGAARRLG